MDYRLVEGFLDQLPSSAHFCDAALSGTMTALVNHYCQTHGRQVRPLNALRRSGDLEGFARDLSQQAETIVHFFSDDDDRSMELYQYLTEKADHYFPILL